MEIGGVHRLMPLMIQATEYTPGISTISAIVRLALAALEQLQNPLKSAAVQAHHVYKIVSRADIARQCILLVPVLGNVFVATTDYIAHRKTESAKILSQQLQEQVTEFEKTKKFTNKQIKEFIQSVNQEDAELLMTPWFILEVVAFCPKILEHTPLQNDKTFVLEAYKQHPQILHFVGKSLKEDRAFWLEILEKCNGGLQFLPKTFLRDKNFILQASKHFTSREDYDKIDSSLWKNAEFCLEMFKTDFQTTAKFSSELWKNKQFVLAILAKDPGEVEHIPEELWTDVEFCNKALIRSGEVAEIIRDNITEVQAADEGFWVNVLSLPDERVDPGRLIPLLEKIPQQLREKENFMTYVAQQVPGAEKFAGPELQKSATFKQAVADLYQSRT